MKTCRLLLPALVLSALAEPAVAAIRPCATPITLSPPSLTVGTTGLSYSQTLTAAGGTAFTFSTTQGVLPPGLAFANPTATTIDIAGSPTTPGTFVFTITARNTPNGCSGGRMFALFVNDRTVVTTTPGTTVFVEDGGPVVVDAGVTVSDTDSPNLTSATVTITNPQDGASEVLAATACAGLTVTPGLNTVGISGSQPPAAYQSCLRSVTYDNSSQNRGTTPRVLSFVANDGTASSAAANKTVSVAGSDDPPVANPITPPAFGEDAAAVITLSYTDPDGDQATACAVTAPTSVTVSTPCACDGAGLCTVGVTGSPLNYNGPASFSYTVTANAQPSNSALASLTIAAVDDPPVANAISPAAFNEDTQSIITLSYSDVESDLATACAVTVPTNVTVSTPCACSGAGVCTVGVTGSPLNYNGPASFSYTVTANAQTSNSATASLTISPLNDPPVASAITPPAFNEDTQRIITLSYSDVEADLATACAVTGPTNVTVSTPCACSGAGVCTVGVTGSPLHYNGAASFTYTVTAGAQTSNSATASLTITPVADPPVADPITPAAFDEDTAAIITLSYTDPDGDQATACAVSGPTNVTVSTACACSAGVCTVGVTGTPLNYNGAASFSYTVTANAQTSNSALASLTITAVNDAPVLGGVAGGFTYTENDAATAIAPALTVTDVDSSTLSSATITFSANFQSGQDVLSFTNGAGMGNIAGSFAGSLLTLTSAGSTATTAQWQTALRAVRYNNSSDDPNTSVRTVTFQVNDGASANNLSNQVSGTIAVTAVNDPPTAIAFSGQPAQAAIPITYPAGKLGGTDLEAGTTITIDLTPINVTNATVSLAADGSFTLTPFPAATTASFQYRVSDNGNPAPGVNSAYATVSFTVAGPALYFVRSAGAGNCTLGNECTLAQAVTNIGTATNARIFISDANSHAAAVPLNSGGWLIGQGVTGTTFDALFGIGAPAQGTLATRPSLAQPRPTVTNTATLNANSAVRGLNVSSAAATGITDVPAAITGALVSEVAVTTTTATAVSLSNNVGTFSFTGVTTTGGAGVSLTGANAGATFSFSALSISSGANAAFAATGGGTVTVTGATNTLASTTGTALNVANTTIGAGGMTFRSIAANGAANGIVLNATGSNAGLTVAGTGTNNSGGIIQNTTGDGISLSSTRDVSLSEMRIFSSNGSNIDASGVTNLTLNSMELDSSNDHGVLGNNVRNLVISGGTYHRGGADAEPTCNLNGVQINNLLGTSSITGATFSRSNTIQFHVVNSAATNPVPGAPDTLTVSGVTGSQHNGPCGGDHLSVAADTGGNFRIVSNAAAGENNFGAPSGNGGGIGIQAVAQGSGTMQASITGVETNNNTAGVVVAATANSNIRFNVFGNKTANGTGFASTGSLALALTCTTSGTCEGAFDDNTISHTAGTGTNAMQIAGEGDGTIRVTVSNNVVSGNFQRGLQVQQGSGTGAGNLSAHVTNNNFNGTDATGLQGMNFQSSLSGDNSIVNTVCLNLANNTVTMAGGLTAYRVVNRATDVFRLQNFTGNGSLLADIQAWVAAKGNIGAPTAATIVVPYQSSPGCATPTLP